jgi:hypothetical protein
VKPGFPRLAALGFLKSSAETSAKNVEILPLVKQSGFPRKEMFQSLRSFIRTH